VTGKQGKVTMRAMFNTVSARWSFLVTLCQTWQSAQSYATVSKVQS
jgi:hypothetical protein